MPALRPDEELQRTVAESARGKIVACDSAYDVRAFNRGRDVMLNASYSGVLPARYVGRHVPRGAIGVDCAIGLEAAGISGLWYLEALGVPAAAADVFTVELGRGESLYETGVVSRLNEDARGRGVREGMSVREAAHLMLERDAPPRSPDEIDNREVVADGRDGRQVVCLDSIALGRPEDRGRNVLCGAGHCGRSAAIYLRHVAPLGFIGSDGGRGRDDSGMAGIYAVEPDGLAVATVDARTARMGDGHSTYADGTISAVNAVAEALGVAVGQPAREAAALMLDA
ncbi:hypothetical protein [Conexibacter sp. CPCC 206217]|uniref:hypothetical protein n=1 Tax=Conexibacter sp. CPCC 206217 TaxID=3064574 RepID=UPI002723C556|nr:hypothetical protein [Conexibacter sp. CPCC 206217]MDO8212583.1 hypothetical protein [Conexibacter sp. CPCC 206217]